MSQHAENSQILVWFRQDLRLADNPALAVACQTGKIVPVYILDDTNSADAAMGGASRWWLHQSLRSLSKDLQGKLVVLAGDPQTLLPQLASACQATHVMWNRCYEPWRITRDKNIKDALRSSDIEVRSFNGSLLWEPWEVLKDDGTAYKVFTPFFRNGCLKAGEPPTPRPRPRDIDIAPLGKIDWESGKLQDQTGDRALDRLQLMPDIPWYESMADAWEVGEQAADKRLDWFLDEGLPGYRDGRNFPAQAHVSRLSPHLHFGEISPRQAWHRAKAAGLSARWEKDLETFLSELGWREFSHSLLYFNPDLPENPIQEKFRHFPWAGGKASKDLLKAWQRGQTGFPLVDAGMRELWQTGYMHNRVRMVVGSFLVKNLSLHWHHGQAWFWDCLVDADLANNSASWQWIAGCGADASPYFRVFNPITQSEKFDPAGEYIRRYVPEIAKLPDRWLHAPMQAPRSELEKAGIVLGETYPEAIVDLKESRVAALDAFKSLKSIEDPG